MDVNSNDELSTTMSLPGMPFSKPRKVSYGLWVKGHITFAANNMDHVHSGHRADYYPIYRTEKEQWKPDELEKAEHRKKSSGINKVPRKVPFNFQMAAERHVESPRFLERFPYVLDNETFHPQPNKTNEALVDNWRPVGIIVTDKWVVENIGSIENPGPHHGLRLGKLFAAQEHWNVPLYDADGNKLLRQPPAGGWPKPEMKT